MSESCHVRVLALGSAAEAVGWPSRDFEIESGSTLAALVERLGAAHPRIAQAGGRLRFAVNQSYADPTTRLSGGDEVAIIPPVSGGALPAARLVREPIDLAALLREVENPAVGGIATFLGVVRFETDAQGRGLRALEYSAYDAMALREMSRLCERVVAEQAVHKLLVVHRLGVLKTGDVSVAAVAAAPHRDEAFEACRTLIDLLKDSVPIFKREIWQDGRGTWVDGI